MAILLTKEALPLMGLQKGMSVKTICRSQNWDQETQFPTLCQGHIESYGEQDPCEEGWKGPVMLTTKAV